MPVQRSIIYKVVSTYKRRRRGSPSGPGAAAGASGAPRTCQQAYSEGGRCIEWTVRLSTPTAKKHLGQRVQGWRVRVVGAQQRLRLLQLSFWRCSLELACLLREGRGERCWGAGPAAARTAYTPARRREGRGGHSVRERGWGVGSSGRVGRAFHYCQLTAACRRRAPPDRKCRLASFPPLPAASQRVPIEAGRPGSLGATRRVVAPLQALKKTTAPIARPKTSSAVMSAGLPRASFISASEDCKRGDAQRASRMGGSGWVGVLRSENAARRASILLLARGSWQTAEDVTRRPGSPAGPGGQLRLVTSLEPLGRPRPECAGPAWPVAYLLPLLDYASMRMTLPGWAAQALRRARPRESKALARESRRPSRVRVPLPS